MPAFSVFFACSSEGNIHNVLGTNAEAPVFTDFRPVSPTEIVFSFSKPVRVASISFDPGLKVESIEEGSEVRVSFAQPLEAGKRITADILVTDAERNTLNVIVPFRARNDRMPVLVFNELRTDLATPRVEFVEFLVLEAGNLGAMRLFIAGHSLSSPVYEFPPAEVSAGEYIMLHLRTPGTAILDEAGLVVPPYDNRDVLEGARHFWVAGNSKLLHRTSALWLMDQDDRILDAVLLCERPAEWGRNNTIAAAEFLAYNGAWLSACGSDWESGWIPGPADAVSTQGTTGTRTINRDQSIPPAPRADNWYVTVTSGNTPGRENNPRRFTP
ncbi:MAG: hypothetical protein FWC64_11865 [Treponema sp.]|nr:hypothetical protein [Treponema sp.]